MLVRYELCLAMWRFVGKVLPFVDTTEKQERYQRKIEKVLRSLCWRDDLVVRSHWQKVGEQFKQHLPVGTYIGDNVAVSSLKSTIGKYCSVSDNVTLGTTFHPTQWLSTSPFQYFDLQKLTPDQKQVPWTYVKPVHIGHDVWIGKGAVIMDGISVGTGAVVGTNAIVTHDVPEYAKVLRYRFDEPTRQKLLELKWWDMPKEDLVDLPYDDVAKCIEILQTRKQKHK